MCPRCSIGFKEAPKKRLKYSHCVVGGDTASFFVQLLTSKLPTARKRGKRHDIASNTFVFDICTKIVVDYAGIAYTSALSSCCRQLHALFTDENLWAHFCVHSKLFTAAATTVASNNMFSVPSSSSSSSMTTTIPSLSEELYFVYPNVECLETWRDYYLLQLRKQRWLARYQSNVDSIGSYLQSYIRVKKNPAFGKLRLFATNDVYFVLASNASTNGSGAPSTLPQLQYDQVELILRADNSQTHTLRSGLIAKSCVVVGDSRGNIAPELLMVADNDTAVQYHAFVIFVDHNTSCSVNVMYSDVAQCMVDLDLLGLQTQGLNGEGAPGMFSVSRQCDVESRQNVPFEVYYVE